MNRVFLGEPYNREFWWNTAKAILNEYHRGKHDHIFVRNQKLPDAAYNGVYIVGGVGTEHISMRVVRKYTDKEV